jgi:hypothetical protein
MPLSMPETPVKCPGKTRRLWPAAAAAALCAALVGAAVRHCVGDGTNPDAGRPFVSGAGVPDAALRDTVIPAGTIDEDGAVASPPVVVRGTGAPASAPGPDEAARHAADAGERERIFRLAEEEAERRFHEASSLEAGAAITYRRAAAGAARGKTGAGELAEAEEALERARAAVRTARREFEAASLKRAEAGAEAKRAAGTAGGAFPGRPGQRQGVGREYQGRPLSQPLPAEE